MTYPDAPSRSRLLRGSAALSCVGLVLALAACGASADALSVAGGIGGDSSTGGSLGTLTGVSFTYGLDFTQNFTLGATGGNISSNVGGPFELNSVLEDSLVQQKQIIFDPIPRVEGIEPSADPLLELRAAIYLLSGRERRAAKA